MPRLPWLAALAIGAAGTVLWAQATRVPRESLRRETEVLADQLADRLATWIGARLAIVEHFRDAWPESYQGDEAAFRHDARLFVQRFPGFRALNFVDADWVIRVVVPAEGNGPALGRDLHRHPDSQVASTVWRALDSGRTTRTPATIPFFQGGRGFASYAPIRDEHGRLLGLVNAVFDVEQLVDHALSDPGFQDRFRFCLAEEDGSVAYVSGEKQAGRWPLRAERTLRVAGRPWTLVVGPAPATLAATSPWLQAPLLAGLWLLAGALGLLLRAVARRKGQIHALLDSAGHGVIGVDPAVRCTWANPEALRRLGFASVDEIRGRPLHDLVHRDRADGSPYPEPACPIARACRTGERASGEGERFWTREGASFPVEYRVAPVLSGSRLAGAVISFADVTERHRAEAERAAIELQMQKAQKLESLGLMAGGIAHDFNNILLAILGYTDALRSELPADAESRASLDGIRTAARKAAGLCRQLLAYSGGGRHPQRPCDLNQVVREMVTLAEMSISKAAALRVDLSSLLPAIRGDASQLSQVVLNLISNAAEALGPEGGEICVRTRVEERGVGELWDPYAHEPRPPGEYVLLEVEDEGAGMDEATLARIFEPFFTTKFTGRGLGLAATLGIVRSHGGAVEVRSRPGQGSTFRIWLPSLGEAAPTTDAAVSGEAPAAGATASFPVLLVDDEETVRRAARRMLERLGHDPVVASSGSEALERVREQGDRLRCALVDLTMPGLAGPALIQALRAARPGLAIVVSSGFAEPDVLARFDPGERLEFLAKPYDLEQLRGAIGRALGGG